MNAYANVIIPHNCSPFHFPAAKHLDTLGKALRLLANKYLAMDVTELVRFNHAARRTYLQTLGKLPWEEVIKSRGASFDSMRDIFVHLTLVELRMVHYMIPGRLGDWVERPFEQFRDMETIQHLVDEVEDKTEDYLKKLTPDELNREVPMPWRKTPPNKANVESILIQVITEDLYHCGELIALLWQMGAEGTYLPYFQYLAQRG